MILSFYQIKKKLLRIADYSVKKVGKTCNRLIITIILASGVFPKTPYFGQENLHIFENIMKMTKINLKPRNTLLNKARSRVVFGRVTRQTRWSRVDSSCENLPGYPVYKDYRDLC